MASLSPSRAIALFAAVTALLAVLFVAPSMASACTAEDQPAASACMDLDAAPSADSDQGEASESLALPGSAPARSLFLHPAAWPAGTPRGPTTVYPHGPLRPPTAG